MRIIDKEIESGGIDCRKATNIKGGSKLMKIGKKMNLYITIAIIAIIAILFSFYGGLLSDVASPPKAEDDPKDQGVIDYCTGRPESKIKYIKISKINQITGSGITSEGYDVGGTDLGSMFQMNGKMYYVFGDTFGAGSILPPGKGRTYNWRSNVVGYSTDMDPADGITLDGFLLNHLGKAKEIIPAKKIQGNHLTSIPTNGVAVKGKMYLYYMAVDTWSAPGGWATAFSGVYTSADEGENWKPVEGLKWGSDSNFTQVAIVNPEQNRKVLQNDIYFFGVGAGRSNPVTLMKVNEDHVEDKSKYLYFTGADEKGHPQWSSEESEAKPVLDTTAGELSVAWNEGLERWIMTYFNGKTGHIDIAEADNPWGPWSEPNVLVYLQAYPGLYGSYVDPSFIQDDGKSIYFTMSQWNPYNVFNMKAELELKNEKIDHVCTSLQSEKESVAAGESFQVEAIIQNISKDRFTDVAVDLDFPEGWEIKRLTNNPTGAVDPNHEFRASYQVSVPITEENSARIIAGKVTFQRDNQRLEIPLKETINVKPALEIVKATFDPEVLVKRGESTTIHITLHNNRSTSMTGQLSLKTPAGWDILPKQQSFELSGEQGKDFTFTVEPPDDFTGVADVVALALSDQKAVASKELFVGVGGSYLSDLEWESSTTGWGPVERDMSIGQKKKGDGFPLTLNGVIYKKGLGVHSHSEIIYDLKGESSRFISYVGVDDRARDDTEAKITFEVWGDGNKLYDSGPMTATSETQKIDISIEGIQKLKLVVTDGSNARSWDHGNWANAWITYSQ
jgi:hypothetical protein